MSFLAEPRNAAPDRDDVLLHMIAGDQNDAFSQAVIEFLERDVRPTLRES